MEILIGVFVDCFGVEVGLINCAFTANCEAGFDFSGSEPLFMRLIAADTSSRRRIAELLACTSKGIAFFSEPVTAEAVDKVRDKLFDAGLVNSLSFRMKLPPSAMHHP
jgi:hypothetical protein